MKVDDHILKSTVNGYQVHFTKMRRQPRARSNDRHEP
jgi:hypothetical protein